MDERIIKLAKRFVSDRLDKDADTVFAAGSIIRGEGTPFSDLDLVVVYAQLPSAYRDFFKFDGFPIEAFVHNPESSRSNSSSNSIARAAFPRCLKWVAEGIEIPEASAISQGLKRRAVALIAAGPPALDRDSELSHALFCY